MSYLYINSAHTASAGQSVTGSIVKIQALHKALKKFKKLSDIGDYDG